jgi:hypothetical protein
MPLLPTRHVGSSFILADCRWRESRSEKIRKEGNEEETPIGTALHLTRRYKST